MCNKVTQVLTYIYFAKYKYFLYNVFLKYFYVLFPIRYILYHMLKNNV
jgi:hypothetical protein